MQIALKLLIANLIIGLCVWLGKKHPSLAGLIATMPITSLIILLWLQHDNAGENRVLTGYVTGAFCGILPTLFFFGAAWFCLKRGLHLPTTLAVSFAAWLTAAALHQLLLK